MMISDYTIRTSGQQTVNRSFWHPCLLGEPAIAGLNSGAGSAVEDGYPDD
jgi:hypothetical protein